MIIFVERAIPGNYVNSLDVREVFYGHVWLKWPLEADGHMSRQTLWPRELSTLMAYDD